MEPSTRSPRLGRRLALTLIVALVLLGTSALPAAAATPAAQASSDSGLLDGQSITVTGSGFSPSPDIALAEGLLANPQDLSYDNATLSLPGTGAADGSFTASYTVKRFVTIAGTVHDCAQPGVCALLVGNLHQLSTEVVKVPIRFEDVAPPPDTTAPTVSLGWPADGATYVAGSTINASYSCADRGGSDLASCTGTLPNGTPLDAATAGTFTFSVTAVDGEGNETSVEHTYTVVPDTLPPIIGIQAPADGTTYRLGRSVRADYSCDDNGLGTLASCEGTVPNGALLDTATPGTQTFAVTATDLAGNTATLEHTYTVAEVQAASAVVTPSSDLVDGQSVTVTVTGLSPNPEIFLAQGPNSTTDGYDSSTARVAGTGDDAGNWTGTFPVKRRLTVEGNRLDCAQPGACAVLVANINEASTEVFAAPIEFRDVPDTTGPTVTITRPASGGHYLTGTTVQADYTCADAGGSGVASCEGTVPNGGAIDTSTPGDKTFSVTATDGDGNTTTVERIYTVNTPIPPVATVSPTTGLQDRDFVSVTGSGFSPSPTFAMAMGLLTGYDGVALPRIDFGTFWNPPANPDGTLTINGAIVSRFITVDGVRYDCAEPGRCAIFIANMDKLPNEIVAIPVQFGNLIVDEVVATVSPGDVVSTHPDTGQTAEDPVGTSVTSPSGGAVSIVESDDGGTAPPGYGTLGRSVAIEAPPATVADPLRLVFDLDASLVPAGETEQTIQVLRDGVPIAPCTGAAGTAAPDPCVTGRELVGGGDVRLTVFSSHASLWSLGVIEDTEAPTITVTAPADGATFTKGQAVTPAFTCADEAGGSGVVACEAGALDTTTVGSKTLTVRARDAVGNEATVTRSYRVVYAFRGFFEPVDAEPVRNRMKAGYAVPVRFSLGGNQGMGVLAAGSPSSAAVPCASGSRVDDVEVSLNVPRGGFTYVPLVKEYVYLWKTDKAWAGTCRRLTITLADGTAHTATFQLTR